MKISVVVVVVELLLLRLEERTSRMVGSWRCCEHRNFAGVASVRLHCDPDPDLFTLDVHNIQTRILPTAKYPPAGRHNVAYRYTGTDAYL
jgi:hypothetical protein